MICTTSSRKRSPCRHATIVRPRAAIWFHACSILMSVLCVYKGSATEVKVRKKDYAVYINAGLRDLKAKVYVWDALSYTPDNLPPKLVLPERLGVGGSIASAVRCHLGDELCRIKPSFLDTSGNVREDWGDTLTKLLTWCRTKLEAEKLTEEDLKKVPLFVGCSASLQSIAKQQREELLTKVQDFFMGENSVSPFLRNPSFTFLLSSKEEPVYAWLASNGLLGTLGGQKTYGIVSLGRDWAGIAFQSDPRDLLLAETYEVKLTNLAWHWQTLKGNPTWPGTIRLYAHAYMYLGRDTFVARMNAWLAEVQGAGSGVVSNPCMPEGSEVSWQQQFSKFLSMPKISTAGLKVQGSSNFSGCYENVKRVLGVDEHFPCFIGEWPHNDCGLDNGYRPVFSSSRKFLGIRGFNQFANFLAPILTKRGLLPPWTLSDLFEGSRKICEMNWDGVKAYRDENRNQFRGPVPKDKELKNSCMLVTFSYSFLVDGLKFKSKARQLIFLTVANNHSITVADGLILKHVNQLPWKLNLELETDAQKEIALPAFFMGLMGTILGYSLIILVTYIRRRIS